MGLLLPTVQPVGRWRNGVLDVVTPGLDFEAVDKGQNIFVVGSDCKPNRDKPRPRKPVAPADPIGKERSPFSERRHGLSSNWAAHHVLKAEPAGPPPPPIVDVDLILGPSSDAGNVVYAACVGAPRERTPTAATLSVRLVIELTVGAEPIWKAAAASR